MKFDVVLTLPTVSGKIFDVHDSWHLPASSTSTCAVPSSLCVCVGGGGGGGGVAMQR